MRGSFYPLCQRIQEDVLDHSEEIEGVLPFLSFAV